MTFYKQIIIIASLLMLMLRAGCDMLGGALDELSMQADLLMYGEEAEEYYADTLSARETFNQKKDELNRLCEDARKQIAQNDRTTLENPSTWKILWMRCHNVVFDSVSYTLTDKQTAYIDDVASSFKVLLEEAGEGNIIVECVVEDIEYPLYASEDDEHDGPYLSLTDTAEEVARYGLPGAYDAVMFLSALPVETFAGKCNLTVKHGYGYANVLLPEDIDNDYLTRPDALQSTVVAMHEFIHMLVGYNPILGVDVIPNPDEADKHSSHQAYFGHSGEASLPFYDDILRGRVKTREDTFLGMYPQIWRITPRYLIQIGALEYLLGLGD